MRSLWCLPSFASLRREKWNAGSSAAIHFVEKKEDTKEKDSEWASEDKTMCVRSRLSRRHVKWRVIRTHRMWLSGYISPHLLISFARSWHGTLASKSCDFLMIKVEFLMNHPKHSSNCDECWVNALCQFYIFGNVNDFQHTHETSVGAIYILFIKHDKDAAHKRKKRIETRTRKQCYESAQGFGMESHDRPDPVIPPGLWKQLVLYFSCLVLCNQFYSCQERLSPTGLGPSGIWGTRGAWEQTRWRKESRRRVAATHRKNQIHYPEMNVSRSTESVEAELIAPAARNALPVCPSAMMKFE